MTTEQLAAAAYQTYTQAGGDPMLCDPEVAFAELNHRHRTAWTPVARWVEELDGKATAATQLAGDLARFFFGWLNGSDELGVLDRKSLKEQIAWEAVARELCRLANADEDDDEAPEAIDWKTWSQQQLQQRGHSAAATLQDA